MRVEDFYDLGIWSARLPAPVWGSAESQGVSTLLQQFFSLCKILTYETDSHIWRNHDSKRYNRLRINKHQMRHNNIDILFASSDADFRKMATFQGYTYVFGATQKL